MLFGRSFGKELDHDIQGTQWYKNLPEEWRWIVKRLLDFLHHWWMGLFLVVYASQFTLLHLKEVEVTWFGWGLFADDIPDIPARLLEIWKDIKDRYVGG